MDPGENDRRLAGIGRRSDPRVDAEVCRQHDALPVECRRDALPALAAGGDERGDAGDEDEGAQRVGVAPGHARRRPAGLEGLRGGAGALDMGVPQRERIGIARRDRERVDERGRRTMAQPAGVVEPAQTVGDGGHAHKDEGRGGRERDDGPRPRVLAPAAAHEGPARPRKLRSVLKR